MSASVAVKVVKNGPPQKRNEDDIADEPAHEPELDLSKGLSRLGYAPNSDTLSFARGALGLPTIPADLSHDEGNNAQTEDIMTALRSILPKLYSDLLVQNFLNIANYQYYTCFPPQLQTQCAEWWEDRAEGRRLSPEFTCLLLQVCASSTQFLEEKLRDRFESELGEKAQTLTGRFHAAAWKLSATIPPGKVGDAITMVQQLFLGALWFKYEAKMIEAWHSIGSAIRAAQESGMHKDSNSEGLSEFDREMRRRLWCIIWNADWQMSSVLSRPVHTNQRDMRLGLPSRLEGNADPEVPTPIASVAYQAQIGVIIYPLFQQLARDNSVDLTLKIEREVEKWMDTFPPVLRDIRPNKDWDEKYPYIPILRCQLNVVAYSFLLGPLKAYLVGAADPKVKGSRVEKDLRAKGVDVCLDLLDGAEKFYKLIYPASVKYFFVLFFIFDGATILCSAIAHDDKDNPSLPKRDRIVLALKNSLHLLEGVSHLSKTAVISAAALKKLLAILPLTAYERIILGLEAGPNKRVKTGSTSYTDGSTLYATASSSFGSSSGVVSTIEESKAGPQLMPAPRRSRSPSYGSETPVTRRQFGSEKLANVGSLDSSGYSSNPTPVGELVSTQQQQNLGDAVPLTSSSVTSMPLEHLENLWDWGNLNMDFSGGFPFGD
ncbi:Pyrimidine pathway regulatory protein 1 [Cytospora mali]|uniref:Pyrimidine pathway regulatory protein 1 n=1 Tax=Cytospora mali TaxID=578113 RepID=A0A194VCK0_CYTMA|nr:Pyrimidine pathway regulatory protein 1 [Valsa mali var. pyri (nom. inval.)]